MEEGTCRVANAVAPEEALNGNTHNYNINRGNGRIVP